jgi:hypothetical protein
MKSKTIGDVIYITNRVIYERQWHSYILWWGLGKNICVGVKIK